VGDLDGKVVIVTGAPRVWESAMPSGASSRVLGWSRPTSGPRKARGRSVP